MNPVGIILLILGLASFGGAWWAYGRRRIIADTPTSKVRSMAVGAVELQGTAVPPPGKDLLRGPFTNEPCVYWEYQVEEQRTRHTKNGTQTYWASVASGRSKLPIGLRDDTGVVMIDQNGADLPGPAETRYGSGWGREPPPQVLAFLEKAHIKHENFLGFNKTMRYTERRLVEGTPLFVHGNAVRRADAAGEGNAALVVQREGDSAFLVSAGSEKSILRKWTAAFWAMLLLGIGLAAGGAYLLGAA